MHGVIRQGFLHAPAFPGNAKGIPQVNAPGVVAEHLIGGQGGAAAREAVVILQNHEIQAVHGHAQVIFHIQGKAVPLAPGGKAQLEPAGEGIRGQTRLLHRPAIGRLQGVKVPGEGLLPGVQVPAEGDFVRVHAAQGFLGTGVHAHGGGDGHQQHGGQDADVVHALGVLLHAVEHAGNRGEVPGLVVKGLVLPQRLQDDHGGGGEQAVVAHNDQQHRHEEQQERPQGIANGHGNGISRAQEKHPHCRHEAAAVRLRLAHVAAAQQVHGPGQVQYPQVAQNQQQEHPAHDQRRFHHALDADLKPQGDLKLQQPQKAHERQLGKQHPCAQAQHQAAQAQEHGFQDQHMGHLALFHAQDVVQPQFLLPALHDKAVGVDQYAHHHHGQYDGAQLQHEADVVRAAHLGHHVAVGKEADDIEQRRAQGAGQQVGAVEQAVLEQVLHGQAGVKGELTHGAHRLWSAWSGYRRPWRTFVQNSSRPGTADGIPPRPAGTAPAPRGWPP